MCIVMLFIKSVNLDYDQCKLVNPLNKLILIHYPLTTVIRSLDIVSIGKHIDFVINKLKQS